MKMKSHFFWCLLVSFLVISCTKDSLTEEEIAVTESVPLLEAEVLDLVNAYRVENGLQELQFSTVAYLQAAEHNDYMVLQGKLSHDHFSKRASTISANTNAEYVGENVAMRYTTAQEALQGWIESASHLKTMTDTFTHTGVSVKKGPEGVLYYTQLFYR